ncbi:hypothetical protein [Microlunatus sp. GCM10028923]|uniref:hypothetical protein n=1 Tax=Microlunatus sp. GCM10028923 TaxID=3273400 RepID=UPI003613D610
MGPADDLADAGRRGVEPEQTGYDVGDGLGFGLIDPAVLLGVAEDLNRLLNLAHLTPFRLPLPVPSQRGSLSGTGPMINIRLFGPYG